jgi:tetratricopeptide (TPR) repeat protein
LAKSNRRKKQDRARADAKQALERRRRDRVEQDQLAQRRLELIRDPATPADELAGLLDEHYEGRAIDGDLVASLLDAGAEPERLEETSRMLWSDESLTAITFAAGVARATGDPAAERTFLDKALAVSRPDDEAEDPAARLGVTRLLLDLGYHAEAAEHLEALVRDWPQDEDATEQYGTAIERIYEPANGDADADSGGSTPGGSSPDPGDAGATPDSVTADPDRDRAALARFSDRSGLLALYDALGQYLAGTEHGKHLQATLDHHRKAVLDMGWAEGEAQGFGEFAEELALLGTADNDDPADNPMAAFAAGPAVTPVLAARATAWYEHIRYGLWRAEDPVPSPGVWCTDIVSAARRYVQFPAEKVGRLPRWAVWMGGLLPVDGIWRITGRGVWLSPREADAAAEFIDRAGDELARAVTGTVARGLTDDHPEKIRFASAGPRGVQAGYDLAFEPKTASLSSRVINALATRIAADVYDYRRSEPRAKHVAVTGFDERLPALRGRTIRQAVRGMPEDQMRVEALLREWEYHSDLLGAAGQQPIDTTALRAELGLPSDLDGIDD